MYKHRQRVNGEYLAKAQTIPQNSSVAGNSGPIRAHNTMGGLELLAVAKTTLTLAATKSITITISDCDTETGTYVALPQVFKATYASGKVFAADDLIGVLPLPSTCRQFVKVTIATDDAAATGTLDIFSGYLPR